MEINTSGQEIEEESPSSIDQPFLKDKLLPAISDQRQLSSQALNHSGYVPSDMKKDGEASKRTTKQKWQSVKQLCSYARPYKLQIVLGTALMLPASICDILVPWIQGKILDLLEAENYIEINNLLVFLILLVLVSHYSRPSECEPCLDHWRDCGRE